MTSHLPSATNGLIADLASSHSWISSRNRSDLPLTALNPGYLNPISVSMPSADTSPLNISLDSGSVEKFSVRK